MFSVGALAADLQPASAFEGIKNPDERSRAIFLEIGRVLQHPRCLNCHGGERPTQGEHAAPHLPLVIRGPDDYGAVGMRCPTCHQAANFEPSKVPGNPLWHMAKKSMVWQDKSLAEICEQMKDRNLNGGRSLDQIRVHVARDALVGWAWNPGTGRSAAPGTQAQVGKLLQAWIASGAYCPAPSHVASH